MKIKINGKEEEINGEQTNILELLKSKKVERPEIVSVQLNSEFVKKEQYGSVFLKEKDEIDFLFFMGGG